jgi:hypothetical protein
LHIPGFGEKLLLVENNVVTKKLVEMSVILQAPSGADIQVNQWLWRPTTLLVRQALQLDDKRFEMLQVNGVGAQVSASESDRLVVFLDDYLVSFPKDGRLLSDGSVTQEPKGSRDFSDGDWVRHYSVDYDWLVRFRDFCRSSGGFKVV